MDTASGGQIINGAIDNAFGGVPYGGGVSINTFSMNMAEQSFQASPCGVTGHRFAWLTFGGQECALCGTRR